MKNIYKMKGGCTVTEWVTLSEASDILGVSERTLRRRILKGEIESKYENGRRFVRLSSVGFVSDKNDNIVTNDMTTLDKDTILKWMRRELEIKNEMIEKLRNEIAIKNDYIQKLQNELKENRERTDAIIIKLAEELEAQRLILEGRQAKGRNSESFWRRIAKREEKAE